MQNTIVFQSFDAFSAYGNKFSYFYHHFVGFHTADTRNPLTKASLMVLIDSSAHALTVTPTPLIM